MDISLKFLSKDIERKARIQLNHENGWSEQILIRLFPKYGSANRAWATGGQKRLEFGWSTCDQNQIYILSSNVRYQTFDNIRIHVKNIFLDKNQCLTTPSNIHISIFEE